MGPSNQFSAVRTKKLTVGRVSHPDLVVNIAAANATLSDTNVGKVTIVTQPNITVTLPSTAAGLQYKIVTSDDNLGFTVAPATLDKIWGISRSHAGGVDNKALVLSNTARAGSYVVLAADGTDGWVITEAAGAFSFAT